MSEVEEILKAIPDTREAELIKQFEEIYFQISEKQKVWYDKAEFFCPDGCGSCCHDFIPDLLEGEALFLGAWIIQNQRKNALKIAEGIFPFKNGKTCPFHDFENPYHCSVYNGRPAVCRLFGASSARDKNGLIVWKPCKFYPAEDLSRHNPPLAHRQYSASEGELSLGALPPVMSDIMEKAVSASGAQNHETLLLTEILPGTVRRLLWVMELCSGNN